MIPNNTMTFRKLRIALTASCLIACVLLTVLWVRSHWWRDYFSIGQFAGRGLAIESAVGQFAFRLFPINHNAPSFKWWQTPLADDPSRPANSRLGFNLYFGRDYAGIVVPHWFLLF